MAEALVAPELHALLDDIARRHDGVVRDCRYSSSYRTLRGDGDLSGL